MSEKIGVFTLLQSSKNSSNSPKNNYHFQMAQKTNHNIQSDLN